MNKAKSILPSQLYTYEKDNTCSKNVKTFNFNNSSCLPKKLLFQTPVGKLCSGSLLPLCGLDENNTSLNLSWIL